MKKALTTSLTGLVLASAPAWAGWHLGEFKDLQVDVQYFDYAYKLPDGEPVYFIGTRMRYRVTLMNGTNRAFNNFQGKATVVWDGNWSCVRTWYDNQSASFQDGTPLPGGSDSGLRVLDMGKGGTASFEATYQILPDVCPGRAQLLVEGRHKNASGSDEVASFRIPLDVQTKRRD